MLSEEVIQAFSSGEIVILRHKILIINFFFADVEA